MRIIVHIGRPKTGSTTLQRSLASSYKFLIKKRVLYPVVKNYGFNHRFLGPIITGSTSIFRTYRNIYAQDQSRFERDHVQFLRRMDKQIYKYKPDTVILSGESLGRPDTSYFAQNLNEILKKWSTDIDIVLYVRDPGQLYLSSVQQTIKSSSTFTHPDNFKANNKTIIKNYERVFPGKVWVIPFEFSKFKNSCIVTDFYDKFIPHVTLESEDLRFTKENISASPEVTYCIQNFRKINYSQADNVFNKQTNYLYFLLNNLFQEHFGIKKAKLYDHIYNKIILNNKDDIIWLHNYYNIKFKNINYSSLVNEKNDFNLPHKLLFEDIVQLDQNIVKSLQYLALKKCLDEVSKVNKFCVKNMFMKCFNMFKLY